MNAIIIEDEVLARKGLRKMLEIKFPEIRILGEASSVAEGLPLFEAEPIDIAFVDVELEDGSGFDLLSELGDHKTKIIFITAFSEYAIKAFRFNALDYLLKPIDPSLLEDAVRRALEESKKEHQLQELLEVSKEKKNQRIVVRTTDRTVVYSVQDILYLKAQGAYTWFVSQNQKLMVSKHLKHYENLLEEYGFLRTHQSFMVNGRHIVSQQQVSLLLSNRETIPISERRRKEVTEKVKQFMA